MFHFIKKGQQAPQWLYKTSNAIVHFNTDVMVHQLDRAAFVFPVGMPVKDVAKSTPIDPREIGTVKGYPTLIVMDIRVMFTNYDELIKGAGHSD